VKALGGRSQVWCCRECNSTIGHDVEGPLQGPGELFNLVAQRLGTGCAMSGTTSETGELVSYDFSTRELRSVKPVTVKQDGGVRTYELRGSADQVRKILRRDYGVDGEAADRLIAEARRDDVADQWITTTLVHKLVLAHRLSAKIALGAGELAFGEDFTTSGLGARIRDVLWGRTALGDRCDPAALAEYDQMFAMATGVPFPALTPTSTESQAVFLPLPNCRVAVVVHVAGVVAGLTGFVLDESLPAGDELPVLVRDQQGGADICHLTACLSDHPV